MTYTSTSSASTSLTQAKQADYAALLLRTTMGVLFLLHGGLKLFVFTPAGTVGFFQSLGLPGPLAYVTIAAEILGGFALIAGVYTRWVSLALVPVIVGAGVFAHASSGFFFSNEGGGWEFLLFWTVALLVQALLGGGVYSLTKHASR
ncbi:DoxX family protein [Sinorhizobium psoraleae]|uniref:DoxX family protein n=1 Tax=Sinorhizobium psoraleae TaxID=520838 RepID=A0ABT4KL40_9HYPH|nr:DoxX family protein [Sinorhizobium psoraleae]MCZ4092505.1 DoxX family protein [Sinorhizobium psoraleae]MCZ4093881.1 DoxX family protein [Sinorhizobium psoraleae]